jgi:hypothetical protein
MDDTSDDGGCLMIFREAKDWLLEALVTGVSGGATMEKDEVEDVARRREPEGVGER